MVIRFRSHPPLWNLAIFFILTTSSFAKASVLIMDSAQPLLAVKEQDDLVLRRCLGPYPIIQSPADCKGDEVRRMPIVQLNNVLVTFFLFSGDVERLSPVWSWKVKSYRASGSVFARLYKEKALVEEKILKIQYYIDNGGGADARADLETQKNRLNEIMTQIEQNKEFADAQEAVNQAIQQITEQIADSKFTVLGDVHYGDYAIFSILTHFPKDMKTSVCGIDAVLNPSSAGLTGKALTDARIANCQGFEGDLPPNWQLVLRTWHPNGWFLEFMKDTKTGLVWTNAYHTLPANENPQTTLSPQSSLCSDLGNWAPELKLTIPRDAEMESLLNQDQASPIPWLLKKQSFSKAYLTSSADAQPFECKARIGRNKYSFRGTAFHKYFFDDPNWSQMYALLFDKDSDTSTTYDLQDVKCNAGVDVQKFLNSSSAEGVVACVAH